MTKARELNMNTVKIAIADDHSLFRKGLVALIGIEDSLEVVLEAGTGKELLDRLGNHPIDVVLMDAEMPEMDGLEATRILREKHPEIRVVMLSAHGEKTMILHAIDCGARGYLLKDSDTSEVIEAIHTVVRNGFCFNQDISYMLLKGIVEHDKFQSSFNPAEQLTEREIEVLQLICQELTSAEIGEKLFLSPRTVETYRKNLLDKSGARNTVGLVLFALKNKLVTLD